MVASTTAPAPSVRARIVSQATRLFATHGFDGTALQDVADAVGVSKPAVIHHFASKEHLRQAVLEDLVEHWRPRLPRLLLAATGSYVRFEALFGELYRFFQADPYRARLLLREVLDRPAPMKRFLRRALAPWIEAIAATIREGQRNRKHPLELDPECFILQLIQLVLAATATGDVVLGVLGSSSRSRYARELERFARASLFSPSPVPLGHGQRLRAVRRS